MAPPEMRDLARRLLTYEDLAGKTSESKEAAILRVYEKDVYKRQVSDIARTLSGIVSLANTDHDMVLPESENLLRTSGFKNTLLNALDEDIVARLRLKPVQFELKHEIESPGDPIDHLYFLEEGMASMTTTFKDGSQIEVCLLYTSIYVFRLTSVQSRPRPQQARQLQRPMGR